MNVQCNVMLLFFLNLLYHGFVIELKIYKELPSLQDLLMLRSNVKCMIVFCDHFLPCIVGKKRWKLQIKQGFKLNSIATVSDEAFMLLLLENCWDYMDNMDEDNFYKPKKRNATKSTIDKTIDNTEDAKNTTQESGQANGGALDVFVDGRRKACYVLIH